MQVHYFHKKYELAQIEKETSMSGKVDKEALDKLKPELLRNEYYDLYYLASVINLDWFDNKKYQATLDELKALPDIALVKFCILHFQANHSYNVKSDFSTALSQLAEAEELLATIDQYDPRHLYDILQLRAVIYADMKEYQHTLAKKYFKAANAVKLHEMDYYLTLHVNTMQCLLDLEIGNYARCIKKLLAILKQCRAGGFVVREVKVLLYLGEVYRLCDKKQLALKYLQSALNLAQENKIFNEMGDIYHCIGAVFYAKTFNEQSVEWRDYFLDKALHSYAKALLCHRSDGPRLCRLSLLNFELGKVLFAQKYDTEAMKYFCEALSDCNKMKNVNERLLRHTHIYIARCYIKQKDYKKALKYIKIAQTKYNETKIKGYTFTIDQQDDMLLVYEFYVEYYESVCNYKQALQYAKQKASLVIQQKNEVTKNLIKIGNMK